VSAEKVQADPFFGFQFAVTFHQNNLMGGSRTKIPLCEGAFSEVTGIEATMTPFSFNEGGRNYGMQHRVGHVDFGTVILKRGMTRGRDLWKWFELVHQTAAYMTRMDVKIQMRDAANEPILTWMLVRALPVKFKAADLTAKGATEVAIEELHLVHEGLEFERGGKA
jgi:phage tail-like protein